MESEAQATLTSLVYWDDRLEAETTSLVKDIETSREISSKWRCCARSALNVQNPLPRLNVLNPLPRRAKQLPASMLAVGASADLASCSPARLRRFPPAGESERTLKELIALLQMKQEKLREVREAIVAIRGDVARANLLAVAARARDSRIDPPTILATASLTAAASQRRPQTKASYMERSGSKPEYFYSEPPPTLHTARQAERRYFDRSAYSPIVMKTPRRINFQD